MARTTRSSKGGFFLPSVEDRDYDYVRSMYRTIGIDSFDASLATEAPGVDAGAEDGAADLVAAAGLAKRYGRAAVFRDVSFGVRPGERVALIGANGAGKSTLLRCLVGLVPADAGRVDILGERFERAPDAAQRRRLRRQTRFVFQRHGLVPRRSCRRSLPSSC